MRAERRRAIRPIGKIKSVKGGEDVGVKVRVRVQKSKVCRPYKQAEFEIIFGEGVSELGCVLDCAELMKVVAKEGSWYSYKDIRVLGRRLSLPWNPEPRAVAKEHDVESGTRRRLQVRPYVKRSYFVCGGPGHSLPKCPKPIENGGTKFASCFVCKQQGHLSKDCPENKRGIYPKMSTWKNTIRKALSFTMVDMTLKTISLKKKNRNQPNQKRQSNQVQNRGGSDEKNGNTKAKAKQAPKVVKFFG